LAAAIRSRREHLGLTLQRIAEQIGCAKSYLSALENEQRTAPGDELLTKLEDALKLPLGELLAIARWQRSLAVGGPDVRREVARLHEDRAAAKRIADLLRQPCASGGKSALDALYASGELRRLVDQLSPDAGGSGGDGSNSASPAGDGKPSARAVIPITLTREVPLINKVAAGYPREFTDLGYPARIADEYVRCPDLEDPDAFAARVVGDSMSPNYIEGDIVVFSPLRPVKDGADCFARLEPDHETTFKRVYFETSAGGDALIRLQPLNSTYAPRTLAREMVAGLYAAVSVMRKVG